MCTSSPSYSTSPASASHTCAQSLVPPCAPPPPSSSTSTSSATEPADHTETAWPPPSAAAAAVATATEPMPALIIACIATARFLRACRRGGGNGGKNEPRVQARGGRGGAEQGGAGQGRATRRGVARLPHGPREEDHSEHLRPREGVDRAVGQLGGERFDEARAEAVARADGARREQINHEELRRQHMECVQQRRPLRRGRHEQCLPPAC